MALLHEQFPSATLTAVGSLRRGCDSCGDIDILAAGADTSMMDAFVEHSLVERVLARGETKSSVLLRGGVQVDLRLVPADSRGAALQYFTGSKSHNIALRDRAIGLGFKLNEYGLFRIEGDQRIAGATEEEIYQALGMGWVPPELREDRGEIDAAAKSTLPRLIERADLRGDLHTHSTETDGRTTVGGHAIGPGRPASNICASHRPQLSRWPWPTARRERARCAPARIRELDAEARRSPAGGIECDIRPDGTMDLADDCLAAPRHRHRLSSFRLQSGSPAR
jgi:DNA polymerase (family 10)